MKGVILLGFAGLMLFTVMSGTAQVSPAQTLRLARSTYEQGHLQELEGLLMPRLDAGGFSKEEKVEAYKLLTQAYIYLEEPAKADQMMANVLRADHFFEPNTAVDPAEFVALYSTFRYWPLFSVGVKIGPNATMPAIHKVYYVTQSDDGHSIPGINFQAGLTFEKQLSHRRESFLYRLTAAPELIYANEVFDVARSITGNDANPSEPIAEIPGASRTLSMLELNALTQYQLNDIQNKQLRTYVSLGPGVHYLLSGSRDGQTLSNITGQVATGASLDELSVYYSVNFSIVGSVGLAYKFGDFYVTADVRYKYGLKKAVDPAMRSSNLETLLKYGEVQDDFTLNRVGANVGFLLPLFNPKKMTR